MSKLTHLSLFSGIGGLDLAAEWAGFQTIGQCEFADYPTSILEKHWPSVPRWRDIRTLTKESFYEKTGIHTTPTIISGGFPCQPFSVAGKQRGADDDRYLWPEMLRVIDELHPNWVIGENVSGLVRIALDDILESLKEIGYSPRAYCFKACELGAPFNGERIAIVASSDDGSSSLRRDLQFPTDAQAAGYGNYHGGRTPQFDPRKWWALESRPYGVVDGIPNRMDRLKCLGNAVVPWQFYPLFRAIADIESAERTL